MTFLSEHILCQTPESARNEKKVSEYDKLTLLIIYSNVMDFQF